MKKNIIIVCAGVFFLAISAIPSFSVSLTKEHIERALGIPILHRFDKKHFEECLIGKALAFDELLICVQISLTNYWSVQGFSFDNKKVTEVAILTALLRGHPDKIREIHKRYALQKRI